MQVYFDEKTAVANTAPFDIASSVSHKLPVNYLELYRHYLAESEYAPATIEKYTHAVECLCSDLNGCAITKDVVLIYKRRLLEELSAASVNGAIAALNNFFDFMGWNDCKVKPVKVQHSACREEDKELTKEEYTRLLRTAKKSGQTRLYHLLETMGSTGIRVSELKFITVESLSKGRVEVRNKGKTRTIFLPKPLCEKLTAYCRKHKITSGSVFVTRNGRPLDRSNIWTMMKRLCEDANVEPSKVFPHNLRHLFARVFYEQYHDLDHLAVVLGHSNINTTRIYTQTSEREYHKQVEMLRLVS